MKFNIFNFKIEITTNTSKRTARATEAKEAIAKEKIINAIKELANENKKITEYAISKRSKCSINTVKKYRNKSKTILEPFLTI